MNKKIHILFGCALVLGGTSRALHFYSAVKLAIKPRIVHNCKGQLSATELSDGGVVKCAAPGWWLEPNA